MKKQSLSIGPVRVRWGWRGLAYWGYPPLEIGGLALFSRDNCRRMILASYHPRKSTTWYWALRLERSGERWSAAARAGLHALWRDGNKFAPRPGWWSWFWDSPEYRRGQWHSHLRLPFGFTLQIARQDYHRGRRDA